MRKPQFVPRVREFSPYAVTQLRGILHRLRALDDRIRRLKTHDPRRPGINDAKRDLMREAKLIGFTNATMRALSRHVRVNGITLSTDAELVDLYRRLVRELDGPRRSRILSKSRPIDIGPLDDETHRP